MVVGEAADVH